MNIQAQLIHTFTGHEGPVYALEQGKGEGGFYSGSGDKLVSFWNFNPAIQSRVLVNVGYIVYSLQYVKEMNYLLIGEANGGMHVVDLDKQSEIRFLKLHQGGIFDIKYSVLYNRIYSVSADGIFAVWSLHDFSLLKSVTLCKEKVRSIALSPDELEVAIACGDGGIRIVDAISLELKTIIPAHELSANAICYHPLHPLLLSGGRDALLKVWDKNSYQLMESIPAHNYAIYDIAFSYDGQLFASASRDKTLKIWDAESMQFKIRLDKTNHEGHGYSVNTILWDKSENQILSGGDDRTIKLWKIIKD